MPGLLKFTELSLDTAPTANDLVITVNDPSGTPTDKKVTIYSLAAKGALFNDAYTLSLPFVADQNIAVWRRNVANTLSLLIISPNGDPGGSNNKGVFQVSAKDMTIQENQDNYELCELTAASPCFGTTDFCLSTLALGTGVVRAMAFGTQRIGSGAAYQIAFRVQPNAGADIYTQFHKLVMFDICSTAGGTALLGANCPASAVSAPYTWIKVKTSDGSEAYIPAWK